LPGKFLPLEFLIEVLARLFALNFQVGPPISISGQGWLHEILFISKVSLLHITSIGSNTWWQSPHPVAKDAF
jgi:hypothetical protein